MRLHPVQKEFFRKLIHLLELPIVAGYSVLLFYFNERVGILALTGLLLLLLEIEYVRLEYQPVMPEFFRVLLRKKEHRNITSTIFFVTGTIIAFSAFDYDIALLALLYTVFGDFASAMIGKRFGKRKLFRQKTVAGFLAGLCANLLVGYALWPTHPLVFVSMALTASVVELLTNKLDDNLTVPLFSGFAGQMLVFLLKM